MYDIYIFVYHVWYISSHISYAMYHFGCIIYHISFLWVCAFIRLQKKFESASASVFFVLSWESKILLAIKVTVIQDGTLPVVNPFESGFFTPGKPWVSPMFLGAKKTTYIQRDQWGADDPWWFCGVGMDPDQKNSWKQWHVDSKWQETTWVLCI